MHWKYAKQIWDKLQNMYQGDSKVQRAKIQVYESQYEILKMQIEEDIVTFFQKVDEVVNTIIGLGQDVNEQEMVQKVLRYLLIRFNPKVYVIEEKKHLNKLTVDVVRGIIMAYEIIIWQEMPSKRESSFKVSKGSKNHDHESKKSFRLVK